MKLSPVPPPSEHCCPSSAGSFGDLLHPAEVGQHPVPPETWFPCTNM